MDAYSQAVTDHNRLQSAHLAALLNGEEQTFHEELALAEVHKENAKFAILAHRREHGC